MEIKNGKTIKNMEFVNIPEWLNENLFLEFLENEYQNFNKITKFNVKPAVKIGENFMTVTLRVTVELELKNSARTSTSYIIKMEPLSERLQLLVKEWKIFVKEHTTYSNYIPLFEKYYQQAGCKIKMAPSLLEPTKLNIKDDFLILEDLGIKGFKNFNRHLGLDLLHTKAVLQKLAQFHAASACHFLKKGPYSIIYEKCLHSENDLFGDYHIQTRTMFRDHLALYGNFDYLKEKLKNYGEMQPDSYHLKSEWTSNKFNVLNHGDCWINNILFQYDKNGRLKETFFIDFQLSCFGSPAQDLLYFLLSATNLEIKLKYFDYFIYFYHQQLKKYLQLLKFEGEIPNLRDIHIDLLKHDHWAYTTISTLMPFTLSESRNDGNVSNNDFKNAIYKNDLYIKNIKMLLPWLDNRGTFDI